MKENKINIYKLKVGTVFKLKQNLILSSTNNSVIITSEDILQIVNHCTSKSSLYIINITQGILYGSPIEPLNEIIILK